MIGDRQLTDGSSQIYHMISNLTAVPNYNRLNNCHGESHVRNFLNLNAVFIHVSVVRRALTSKMNARLSYTQKYMMYNENY